MSLSSFALYLSLNSAILRLIVIMCFVILLVYIDIQHRQMVRLLVSLCIALAFLCIVVLCRTIERLVLRIASFVCLDML